ncbi:HAD family hydrolase [Erwinia pyrifoliae]|uniref:phosphoglycolate phosphatase n=1 Tax=Erwinia pyrifoliae TaxID=79967 RepID=A0ABY5XAJ3_ERWPY|nr:HAD hydrolase-like protein [Erwinia pyrifoliae]MCT2385875.1 HAD hydrolase-like protein [Erwinia pyrifoliae]MCU8588548.1 HAD hydrolase-like protein [Erwinia pyrifoliae]UWS29713.1 HAD hydrolase-like protein [Erwinia pyrifoliae]UWS34028.1 HAD hydrolase-like protein [Erwinia pyrifoliae]UXK12700.1 HAD hydrolase-like protein [Erwinia pyrifoliae]
MNIERFSHIVFDMDGVLIDSNHMKIDAARQVIHSIFPEAADAFADHFRRNFGQTRQAHFSWAYENLLAKEGFSASIINRLVEKYGKIVAENYPGCAVTDGTSALLAQVSRPCYVLTGSDQSEARELLCSHHLDTRFNDILGGPINKSENLDFIINTYGINPAESVLIGDAFHDFEVASHFGFSFILVTQYMPFDNDPLIAKVKSSGGYIVNRLSDLLTDRFKK